MKMHYFLNGETISQDEAYRFFVACSGWNYEWEEIRACWLDQDDEESRDALFMISDYSLEIIPQ
jgi:hypothetical protein